MGRTEAILEQAVFFLHADELPLSPHPLAWQLDSKVLRNHPDTGLVLEVQAPANWAVNQAVYFDCPVELIVLEGELNIARLTLQKGDFLGIPEGENIGACSSLAGARYLMFFDRGNPCVHIGHENAEPETTQWLCVRFEGSPWVAGTALAEAGVDDVPLKIKHYKQDPDTGARTYLVSVNPGITIPWEMHDIAEEAYIVEGDYTLAECLPGGSKIGRYRQGGYFYRPPGIAHNGPASGTKSGVVMLIRTPGPLKVELVDGCCFDP